MHPDQCALNADGALKDASEIQWFNDPDDEHPIGATPSALSSSANSSNLKTKKNLFDVLGKPATIIAGQCRTSRPHKPHINPDNVEPLRLDCTYSIFYCLRSH